MAVTMAWGLQQLPGRSVDDMTKYFPRRLCSSPSLRPLPSPSHAPLASICGASRRRFTTSLRHHLQAPKVAFDFDGEASSHRPRPLVPCCLMTFMQLHSAAMCRRCQQRDMPHACVCVCVCESECVYVWQLGTAHYCKHPAVVHSPSLSLSLALSTPTSCCSSSLSFIAFSLFLFRISLWILSFSTRMLQRFLEFSICSEIFGRSTKISG